MSGDLKNIPIGAWVIVGVSGTTASGMWISRKSPVVGLCATVVFGEAWRFKNIEDALRVIAKMPKSVRRRWRVEQVPCTGEEEEDT